MKQKLYIVFILPLHRGLIDSAIAFHEIRRTLRIPRWRSW